MRRHSKFFVVVGVVLWAAALAGAVPAIDQAQLIDGGVMAYFGQEDLAQSFQQANANVAGAGILLSPWSDMGDVTIALWDNLPNNGGSLLASGTAAGTAGGWVDVFWAPVTVVPDTTLFLVFTSTNPNLGIEGDTYDPYPRGQVYANPGYTSFPGDDYTFRTYFEPVVPAPGALLLAGLGVGLVHRFRRRRAL